MPFPLLQLHQYRAACSVPGGIVEQVADHAGKQPAFALDRCRFPCKLGTGARRLFCGEGLKIDPFCSLRPLEAGKSAGQQDFFNQVVQLGDVPLNSRLQCGGSVFGEHFDRHANARQRRAQFVGRRRQSVPLGFDEGLDSVGRPVEAAREGSNLVRSLKLDPGGKVAGTERFDLHLQTFEPPGQTASQRIGDDGDGQRKQDNGGQEADGRRMAGLAVREEQDGASVRQA